MLSPAACKAARYCLRCCMCHVGADHKIHSSCAAAIHCAALQGTVLMLSECAVCHNWRSMASQQMLNSPFRASEHGRASISHTQEEPCSCNLHFNVLLNKPLCAHKLQWRVMTGW